MGISFVDTGENRIAVNSDLYFAIGKIFGFIQHGAFQFPEPPRNRSDHQVFCIKPDLCMNGVDGPGVFMYYFFHCKPGQNYYLVKLIVFIFLKSVKLVPETFLKNLLKCAVSSKPS